MLLLRQWLRRQLRRLAMKIPAFTLKPYVEKLGRDRVRGYLLDGWGRASAFAEVDERQILGFIPSAGHAAHDATAQARLVRAFDVGAIPLPPAAPLDVPVGFVGPIQGLDALHPVCC